MFDFYTSDIHFGHYNIIKYANRPFSFYYLDKIKFIPYKLKKYFRKKAVEKMNNHFINEWNKKVTDKDKVLIGGDFSFLNLKETEVILNSLNGKKYLVKGNHDGKSIQSYLNIGFEEVFENLTIPFKDINIIFSHYPYLSQELNRIEKSRPNLLRPFNKNKKEDCFNIYDLKKMNYLEQRDFLKRVAFYNIKNKEVRNFVLRLIRSHVGTRLVNKGDILARGHTHKDHKVYNNEINLCVEAHDYSLISHEEFMKYVHQAYDYLFYKSVKDISDLDYLREILRLKLCENREDEELYLKIRKRLKEIDETNNVIKLKETIKNNPNYKLRNVPQNITEEYIEINKKHKTYIPLEELIVGECYKGTCRNASFAIWDGKHFIYLRRKFNDEFLDKVECLEKEIGYDIFVPHEKINKNSKEVEKLYDYYNRR